MAEEGSKGKRIFKIIEDNSPQTIQNSTILTLRNLNNTGNPKNNASFERTKMSADITNIYICKIYVKYMCNKVKHN